MSVDHAAGEHKRVDCLEASIRILMGDPEFQLGRADCFHHKAGLIANAAQKADAGVVVTKVGTDLDKRIREFKSTNIMDMFQRQIALVFSPLEDYVFGSGTIDFPMWFAREYPDMRFATMDRQVGNRHGIMLKNAMIQYFMFDSYRNWLNYLIYEVKEPNALHIRLGSKMQCMEMKAALRARGIWWTHVHHVLLIAIKDAERAADQRDACNFICRLKDVAKMCKTDASPLMQRDFNLFDDDIVKTIRQRWMSYSSNSQVHNRLFDPDAETREITLACLQAMFVSTITQLKRNSAEYLPGGRHYNLFHKTHHTDVEKAQLSRFLKVPITADPMERVYSFLDHDLNAQSGTKLGTASGKTAFRMNKTMKWYEEDLNKYQQNVACNLMRRLYYRTTSRSDKQYEEAREVRRGHLLKKAEKTETHRRNLIKSMLKYDGITIIFSRATWRQWLEQMRDTITENNVRERAWLAKMSEQFNCLRYRCGVRYGLIPRKTHLKDKIPITNINSAYESLLQSIENGTVKAVERSLVHKLLQDAQAFREGAILHVQQTYLSKTKAAYETEISQIKQEYEKEIAGIHTTHVGRGS